MWFLPALGIDIPPLGAHFVALYCVIIMYAIVRYRFLDIQVVIRRSLVYSLLVTLLTVGYFGLVYGLERILKTTMGYHSAWVSLAAFALMALVFQPLKTMIQRVVDRLIFGMPQQQLAKRMEQLEEQALQSEKFKAVSTLAAGMAHEIKNPLTAIQTFAGFILEKHKDPEFARKLQEVLTAEAKRMQELVQDLLTFAKPKAPKLKPVDMAPLIHSTVNLLSGELSKRRVQWSVDCSHNGAAIYADPDQLRQVLINLIQNAADAMPNGGQLKIATQAVNSHLELTISDTGNGIPPALLPKIFDPFITTKPDGNGLGLAMVYSILQAHRGTIHAKSEPKQGTTFTVSLPL
jgi:signal transduction histidine kinase